MLLPRPEMRMATRFGSRIVGHGPVLRGVPGARVSVDGAAAGALFDAADLEHRLAGALKRRGECLCLFGSDDRGHAYAAVEDPRHFFRSDVSALLEQREDRRQLAPAGIYVGMAAIRQNPRNILEKSAAGDMGEALDRTFLHQGKERPHVDARGFEQDFAQRASALTGQPLAGIPTLLLDDLPDEREAVAVNARAGEAEDHVARLDARAGQH